MAEQLVVVLVEVGRGCKADVDAADAIKLDDIDTMELDGGIKIDDRLDGCDAITLVTWAIGSVLETGAGVLGFVCGGWEVVGEGSTVVVVVGGASVVVVVVVVGSWVVVVVVELGSGVGELVPGSDVADVGSSVDVPSVVPESLEVSSVCEVL
jgi:hypothetical protein